MRLKMKKMILSLLLLFSIFLSGCSQKEYVYVHPTEYQFKKYEALNELKVENLLKKSKLIIDENFYLKVKKYRQYFKKNYKLYKN